MKFKCVAILIAFGMVIALASAQPYSIRANRGLNLRVAPSLNADIADTVVSGEVLHVVGTSGNWLKIDRNGREVWLADWVNYSRVDSGAPSGGSAQPTAQIDNCCFVDRQCSSDQEWIDGYWAYQNGQCAAPAQPQPVTPAQPVASAPTNVDNCCFVDRQCASEQEWIDGYWAFQNNQCTASTRPSASTPSRPQIEGSTRFVRVIERTLNLLRDKAPEWYTYAISAIDSIAEIPRAEQDNVFCSAFALVASRRVEIESCFPHLDDTFWSAPINLSNTLVHEACHIHTYEAGIVFPYGLAQEELECSIPSIAVYKVLDPHGRVANLITDLEGVLRMANKFCQLGNELSCQQAKIGHLYYD